MNILDQIVATKRQEVYHRKSDNPEAELKVCNGFRRKCNSLRAELLKPGSSGIIAEFKRKSPSLGDIYININAGHITKKYAEAGATGLSVLTDHQYFGGSMADLIKVREANPDIPLLRKDFIIDPYQITESRAFGADVILLIAACLEKVEAEILAKNAKKLGMEVLFEIHEEKDLQKVNDFVDIVGVNNRNLATFDVDLSNSVELSGVIPDKFLKISESGINDANFIRHLRHYGYNGFLIGGAFMVTDNPGEACRKFISEL